MSTIQLSKKNAVSWHVSADPSILMEMVDFFTFPIPGAQFTPQYKSKLWDGLYRLFNAFSRELPFGLYKYLEEFAARNGYMVEYVDEIFDASKSVSEIEQFFDSLIITAHGQSIQPRDYQRESAIHAIVKERSILLSPTASGKSLILYLMARWHVLHKRRILLIVPTTSLVKQMLGDFLDYGASDPSWDSSWVQTISAGKQKNTDVPITISTWQSVHRLPESYFDQYDVVFGDECHLFSGKSLTTIMNKAKRAWYRVGTTGTLDGTKTHELVLTGLFGPVRRVITTKELMDTNQLANLSISCVVLEHDDEDRKAMKMLNYQQEIDWIVTHPKRNKFIAKLALSQTGNTLVLFQYVEKHGAPLFELIKQLRTDETRPVFFIHGKVDAEIRESVRKITETQHNAIIIASNGVFSTGTNIRNLHNIIFASPSKSRVRNLQSIGRGLRKSDTKTQCKLYDIGDDLSWKKRKNFTLLHMIERIKIYNTEQFKYKVTNVKLSK